MDMGGKTLRIGTSVNNLIVCVASWTLGVAVESARFAQASPSASPCKTEETGPSDRKTAPINRASFDQFTLLSLVQYAKGLQIVSEKCCTVAASR